MQVLSAPLNDVYSGGMITRVTCSTQLLTSEPLDEALKAILHAADMAEGTGLQSTVAAQVKADEKTYVARHGCASHLYKNGLWSSTKHKSVRMVMSIVQQFDADAEDAHHASPKLCDWARGSCCWPSNAAAI